MREHQNIAATMPGGTPDPIALLAHRQKRKKRGRLPLARKWIELAAFGAVALMRAGVAGADDAPAPGASNGPILVAERPRLETLYLTPTAAWLDINYFRDDESQKTNGASSTRFTEDRFQEILTLQTAGYIMHPNLVELKLQGSFGLEQDLINQNGQRDTDDGILYNWDTSATLFRKEELPTTVYSRRITSYYAQPFGPSLQNTIMTEGIVLDWQNKIVPTRVEYYHLSQDQRALNGSQDYQEAQDTLTWHSSYQPTQDNHSTFDYTFNSGTATSTASGFGGQTANDFTNNNISFTNELDFGPQDRNKLQTSVVYFNQAGTYQLSDLHYNETLYLQHTDDFSSNFRYLLDKESIGSGFGGTTADQFLQRGDALFTHHLFKSLTTTGDVGIQSLSVNPSGGNTEWFGNLNFDYTKLVPLGKFNSTLGVAYDQTDNKGTSQVTHIVNQQRTFSGALPIMVSGNDIIANSLIITDTTGVRIYRPGLDYVVRAFPDYLEIERSLGGNIQDGQAVLISYDLATQPGNTLRTKTVALGGRYDFDIGPLRGLGLYGRYIDQSQSVSSSVAESFVPNSLVDKTIGLDYRFWEVKFLAEQDWHHSTIAPYDQLRLDARWVHPIWTNATFTLNPTYIMAHYPENDDRLTALTILASAEYRVSQELSVNGSVNWQDQADKLFGASRGLQEELEVKWTHRQTSVFFQFRNSNLRSDIQSNQYQTIQIGFRRTF